MQLTIYENEVLSKSTSLSMSMMGSRGAPSSLNVRATLQSLVANVSRPEEEGYVR